MLASALPSREGIRACSNEQKKITSPIASQAALIAPLAIPLRRADNRLGPILIPTPHPNLKESMPTHSDCQNRCLADIHPPGLLMIPPRCCLSETYVRDAYLADRLSRPPSSPRHPRSPTHLIQSVVTVPNPMGLSAPHPGVYFQGYRLLRTA